LDELEKISRIKKSYLKALEEKNFKVLPSDVYTRGFLVSLAKILKFSSKELIENYQREKAEYESLATKDRQKIFSSPEVNLKKFFITPRLLTAFIVILVVFGLAFYFWFEISGFASAPALEINEPPSTEFRTKEDKIIFSGRTDGEARLFLAGQIIPLGADGKFSQEIRLQKGLNLIEVVAESKSEKKSKKTFKIVVE